MGVKEGVSREKTDISGTIKKKKTEKRTKNKNICLHILFIHQEISLPFIYILKQSTLFLWDFHNERSFFEMRTENVDSVTRSRQAY